MEYKISETILNKEQRKRYYKTHADSQKGVGWKPLKNEQYQALEKVMTKSEVVHCKQLNKDIKLKFITLDELIQTNKPGDKRPYMRLRTPKFLMVAYVDKEKIATLHFEPSTYGLRLEDCDVKSEYRDTYYTTKGIADLICERIEKLSQEMGINRVFFTGLQTSDVGALKEFTFARRGYEYEPEDQFGECFAEKSLDSIQNEINIEQNQDL